MDYRNILATGFLLLCGSVFAHSIHSANALPQGPVVSMGSFPYESFTGTHGGGSTVILTVPSNQSFVVTTFIEYSTNCSLLADSTTVYNKETRATSPSDSNVLTQGRAHIKINGGEVLTISSSSGYSCKWYVEGYYSQ